MSFRAKLAAVWRAARRRHDTPVAFGPDGPGSGLAAFLLSLSTLLELERNGTLSDHELADIVERSFGKLQIAALSLPSAAEWVLARELLDQVRMRFAEQRSRKRLESLSV